MEKGRTLLRWNAILVGIVIVSFLINNSAVFGVKIQPKKSPEIRADIINIDSMNVFGKLERPSVTFLHQKHTDALEKSGKDCVTCHLSVKDPILDIERMSTLFMRLKNTSKQEVLDIYHAKCIGCHKETKAAKEKSGPLECGECHQERMAVISSRQPIGMNKSLHYRHAKARDNKCGQCHHEYNESTKKLFYAKGKEGTCRYCHQEKTEGNRVSMRLASHIACIDCHRRTLAKNESAGPFICGGCHDPAEQKLIETIKDVPRLKRNQPYFVFVNTTATAEEKVNSPTRMDLVPFNHQAHEKYNDSCRVCHHAALNECGRCHTLRGSKNGNFVTTEQAMHRINVSPSCLGCHQVKQGERSCAGCHTPFEKKRSQDTSSCTNCHRVPKSQIAGTLQQAEAKMMVAGTRESREAITETYTDEDIPETVAIKALTNKYDPVQFPHRKIVNALFNNIKNSNLAKSFHHGKGTICQGCHHNSPAGKKPPGCVNCHDRPFNEKDGFKPGLMAAYHIQCMECHKAMDIQKPVSTDCTACHVKKS